MPDAADLDTTFPRFQQLAHSSGGSLGSDLADFPKETAGHVRLQYVEDFLLSSDIQEDCMEGTQALLQL